VVELPGVHPPPVIRGWKSQTGQASRAVVAPRLDRGTQLVNRALVEREDWRVKVWEDAGEAVIWRAWDEGPGDDREIGDGKGSAPLDDEQDNRDRAARRARSKVRRYSTVNQLSWLVTLTYRPPQPTDPVIVLADVQAFQRRLEVAHPALVWLRVFELHRSGALHVHFLTNGPHGAERRTRAIAGLWGHGFVDARRFGNGGRGGSRRAARYASKYVSKGAVAGFGRHSYEVRQGYQPLFTTRPAYSLDAAWRMAVGTMGGEVPSFEWRSSSVDDWHGPPVVTLGWP
jgi:hypothetical protein